MEMEKKAIIDFLKSQDADLGPSLQKMSLMELIDFLIDEITEMELDYSILSTAFMSKVNPDRFEQFHSEVMNEYDKVQEGDEIPPALLDKIAERFL